MKKRILSITPNPALDLSGRAQEIIPNEKTYVFDERRDPGGNALNAARIIHRLGSAVTVSGFLGGSTGEEVKNLILEEGLKAHFIKIKSPTRVNVTVWNMKDHRQTRLSFPGPRVSRKEKEDLLQYFRKSHGIQMLLLGGSLPSGFSQNELVGLMREAKKRGIPTIVDSPADILKTLIKEKPLLVKPNLEEFHQLTGSRIHSLKSVVKKASTYLGTVRFFCVSSVEGGTVLVTREGSYFGKIPKVKIRSTVGAGDSMVGAMAAAIFNGEESPEEVLRWGLAASAATLSHQGTHLGSASLIRSLRKKTQVTRL